MKMKLKIDSNPFFIRAAQSSEMSNFLKLFSSEVLNAFEPPKIWNQVNVIRSSPGGGKTTLLKLFTPQILSLVKDLVKDNTNYKPLFNKLRDFEVYKNGNTNLIGALISFNDEYSSLEYLDVNQTFKIRLFNSFLNSRLTLSILRSICEIKEINFPDDLIKVNINASNLDTVHPNVPLSGNGIDYYNWACKLEENICKEIDSVLPINDSLLTGHSDLFVLKLFNPENIIYENKKLDEKILVMLDDVHNLSKLQRTTLLEKIINMRPPVKVWIAERYQALTMQEHFSLGNKFDRDYNIIELEQFWQEGKKFESFCSSVADKRVSASSENQILNFSSLLSSIFNKEINTIITKALAIVKERVIKDYGDKSTYKNWINTKKQVVGDDWKTLVEWRTLEILLNREKNKTQGSFEFFELSEKELEEQEGTDVKHAAELFLMKEFNIPFYYSFSKISGLSSYNIDQFLGIAGDLYEDIISLSVIKYGNKGQKIEIAPLRQEELVRKYSNKKWDEIDFMIPESTKVKKFLTSIGEYCQSETYKKNAWNSPGLNGIAISMEERKLLKDSLVDLNSRKNPYRELSEIIALCISYNLLEFKLGYKGQGKELFLLYLNKLLCVKFNLPLHRGGYKARKLKDLASWINYGFQNENKLWD